MWWTNGEGSKQIKRRSLINWNFGGEKGSLRNTAVPCGGGGDDGLRSLAILEKERGRRRGRERGRERMVVGLGATEGGFSLLYPSV